MLTNNVDPNKYGYSGYGIRLEAPSQFLLGNGKLGKMLLFLVWKTVYQCILIIEKEIC